MSSNFGPPKTSTYGLEIIYERDASMRSHQIVFIDNRQLYDDYDIGGMLHVPDKWLRERGLSIDKSGMIFHTLMTIFAAFWTKSVALSGLGYIAYSPPHNLIDGVAITGCSNTKQKPLW